MKKLCYIFVTLFCFSCANEQLSTSSNQIDVNIDVSEQWISADNIIDTQKADIIRLDNDKGNIGMVEDIRINDKYIYLLDGSRNKIHVFNPDGTQHNVIDHHGRASNEYIEISDFFPTDDMIYILDRASNKILAFNYDDTMTDNVNISDYWANRIFVIGESIFLVNEGSDCKHGKYHLFRINSKGKLLDKYIPFEKNPGLVSSKCYAVNGNTAWYCQRESNTVYEITENECSPYINLDFGKYNMPEKYVEMDARGLLGLKIQNKYSLGIESIDASDRFLFLKFQVKGNNYTLIYDRDNDRTSHLCRGVIIDFGYHIGLMNYTVCNNDIYDLYYSEELPDLIESIYNSNEHDKYMEILKALSKSISQDDNPIIFKYQAK